MTLQLTQEDVAAIRATPKPRPEGFSEGEWTAIENRIGAMDALLEGSPIIVVAANRNVDRKTLRRMLQRALGRGEDGHQIGYFACIPRRRFAPPTPRQIDVPNKPHAFAFVMVLRAIPEIAVKVHSFKGPLPTRHRASPSFNRLYNSIAAILKSLGHQNAYPLNTSDGGRRALQTYLKRHRAQQEAEVGAERPEDPSITRLEHLFSVKPFDRFEYDEHKIDVDAWMALPLADGTFRLEHISRIWILAIIDVGSTAIVAWSLVLGRKYQRLDVLELFARTLRPWVPRDLVVPGMKYSPRAWMPTCDLELGLVAHAIMAALDNDSSHLSHMSLENLADYYLGVLHFGRSGMGEGRPYIEAFFHRIEDEILRYIAGGFKPGTISGHRVAVSTLRGDRYPILVEPMEDLIDTYVTAHNVTDRSSRDTRTPKMLIEDYRGSGALMWRCPESLELARRLTVKRMRVKISGSKSKGVPPVVYSDYARYRSPQLAGQWSLIGRDFVATYEAPDDIRELTLWEEGGRRLLTLHALPPYSAVPHPLSIRQRAAAWCRGAGLKRKAAGDDAELFRDNIVAYHQAVRAAAATMPWASGLITSGDVPGRPVETANATSLQDSPLRGIRPLASHFSVR